MTGQQNENSKKSNLSSVDPVWFEMLEDAKEIARREPSLSGFIFSTVLNHESFEEALAFRLAQRLGHEDVSSDLIRQAFADALDLDPTIGAAARADVVATRDRDPACDRMIDPLLYFKGFQAVQTHRFAHALYKAGRTDFAYYLQSRSSQVFQVDINPAVRIGLGLFLDHGTGVVIGETAEIGNDVSILQNVTLGGNGKETGDRHPKVRDGVLVGAGAKVLGNIEIGNCARVGAGSVLLEDVPPMKTVAGVPAKVVGEAGCTHPSRKMDHMVST